MFDDDMMARADYRTRERAFERIDNFLCSLDLSDNEHNRALTLIEIAGILEQKGQLEKILNNPELRERLKNDN